MPETPHRPLRVATRFPRAAAILLAVLVILHIAPPLHAWTQDGYLISGLYEGYRGITEFDGNGERVKTFGIFQVQDPGRMALDAEGNLLVSDSFAGNVKKFDPDGNLVGAIGDGHLTAVGAVAVGPGGAIYVGDRIRGEIQVFSAGGAHLRTFGGDLLLDVSDLRVTAQGLVIVADGATGTVRKFTLEGQPAGSIRFDPRTYVSTLAADDAGCLCLAQSEFIEMRDALDRVIGRIPLREPHVASSLRMDGDGNLILLDYLSGSVQLYDREGDLLMEFGGETYRYANDVLALP